MNIDFIVLYFVLVIWLENREEKHVSIKAIGISLLFAGVGALIEMIKEALK